MADAVCVCDGVRCVVDTSDSASVELLKRGYHPWQQLARERGLTGNWGGTVDKRSLYVLLGMTVGFYGREFEEYERFSDEVIALGITNAAEKLRAAGIKEVPAWHFQFEPDGRDTRPNGQVQLFPSHRCARTGALET